MILLTAIVFGCSKSAANDGLSWESNLETALQKAKTENKAVLVNFTGSDWCQWCIKLSNEVFSQPDFEKYAEENLILVKLDFPKSIEQSNETKMYNNSLAQKIWSSRISYSLIIQLNWGVSSANRLSARWGSNLC
jgi:thioredoxin-related protein